MPMTTREGIFAVYQPEPEHGSPRLPPIHVLSPTPAQKNAMLVVGAIYPGIFGGGPSIAAGVLHDYGHYAASEILYRCACWSWALMEWTMAFLFFYYGLKLTIILQANIIIAEAALQAPTAAFGIRNLTSKSPARFLFIQLQILGFGGCSAFVLAGSVTVLMATYKEKVLGTANGLWPHVLDFFWTCAFAIAILVAMALITVQSVRSRRRGLHNPSSNVSQGHSSGRGDAAFPPITIYDEGARKYSGVYQPFQNQGGASKGSKLATPRSDAEACLISDDASVQTSIGSNKGHTMDMERSRHMYDSRLEGGNRAGARGNDPKSYKAPSLTPPPRPLPLVLSASNSTPAFARESSESSLNPDYSQIREFVFGGRPSREGEGDYQLSSSPTSLSSSGPRSPTLAGFSLPSPPLPLQLMSKDT
ncbi:hypothetical protein BGX28_004077 [Mortierella sp. GBA30]|nr:hypothetical protein BGX28_004077 [Mortierella sp. GBA30]